MSEPEVPDVVKALRLQAGICRNMGSALNGDLLDRAVAGQQTQGHPIVVVNLPLLTADAHCQMVYIASTDPQAIHELEAAIAGAREESPAVDARLDRRGGASLFRGHRQGRLI